jgi:MFS family permease
VPATDARALARWRWAITTAFALGGITLSAWGPRLPAIKTELGIDTGTIGLLLAGVTVGAIGGLLGSTPVLHWLGARRALAGALWLIAAAITVMALALIVKSVPLVAAALVITGAGIGTLDVLINVEGSAVEQTAGRTLLPSMHAAWSIGAAVGSGIGAACAALSITPATQLLGEAVLIVAASFWVAAGIPPGQHGPAAGPPQDRAARLRQWLRGWLDWRLLLIGVVMLGCELGEGSANSWLTLAAHSDHGQSAAVAALFFTVFAASEGITRLFAGPVVDRLGRVRTVRLTTALGVVGIALFIVSGNPWIILIGVALWAIGVSMGFPLGMSAAAESGPDPAARISVVASIGYFANLAGPPAIGAVAQSVSLLSALWVIAALFVAAFAVAGALGPGRTVAEPAGLVDLLSQLARAWRSKAWRSTCSPSTRRNSSATIRVSSSTVNAGSPSSARSSAECQKASWAARHSATSAKPSPSATACARSTSASLTTRTATTSMSATGSAAESITTQRSPGRGSGSPSRS